MPRTLAAAIIVVFFAAGAIAATPVASDPRLDPELVDLALGAEEERRVIVHLEADADARLKLSPRGTALPQARLNSVKRALDGALSELRAKSTTDIEIIDRFVLRPAFSARVGPKGLEFLLERQDVILIEADHVWRSHTVEGIPLMGADVAQDLGLTGAGTAVAVIDSGIRPTNPILGGAEIPNGKVVYGKDTGDDDDDPTDCGNHGTSVSSLVAGLPHHFSEELIFAGGVAPGAKILGYKASGIGADCGSFSASNVVQAMDDAVLHRDEFNVVAINLSLGGGLHTGPCDGSQGSALYSRAAADANDAGITVLASSGNEAHKERLASPSCVSSIISVGAVYDTTVTANFDDCSDLETPAGSPTCYSNSNSYLDFLAPSHHAAAATLETMLPGTPFDSFGGTSAAAPYAAGGVALLYERYPNIRPGQVSTLLAATGHMTEDTHGGFTRPLIDLGRAVDPPASIGIAWDTPVEIVSGATVSSSIEITDRGTIEGVRLSLNLFHHDPRNLVITLRSPSGTQLRVHDKGEGNTPPAQATDEANGIVGAYPEPRVPAEAFDGLFGEPAKGTWTLEISDEGEGTLFGISTRLEGWALDFDTTEILEPPSPGAFSIPVGVHAAGLNDSFWVTDLRVANPSATDSAELSLYLVPAGADGNELFFVSETAIEPGSVVSLPDVILERFGQASAQGNLIFVTSDQLLATSRTYNTGDGHGTFGQFIAMSELGASFGVGETGWIGQLSKSGGFRTNVGFSEQGGLATSLILRLVDGDDGTELGSKTYNLNPYSNLQINDVFTKLGAPARANAFATVEVSSGGQILAYASVADNATNDAIFIPASVPTAAAEHVVPIVAKIAGAAGTNWSTDLRVINTGNSGTDLAMEFRPIGSDAVHSESFSVAAGLSLALTDLLDRFGLNSASGSLVIRPADSSAPLVVTSRTFNSTSEGTYGQMIPGVAEGFDADDRIMVLNVDQNAAFRSNFGIAEVSGSRVTVRYELKDENGVSLGVDSVELDPWEVVQINGIYGALGVSARSNGRLEVSVDSGEGAVVAYVSVVDKLSGDAIYVPAMGY